ncbi:hypothetical protein ACFX1R_042011 [Malus domestica]
MIPRLCLADGFDMFPTLLVTDGSCMIDRRMGIHGHPLQIQALFYSALLCAREMLAPEDGSVDLIRALNNHQTSSWLVEWMPKKGGYLIGNLQPAHMDFRFFSLGNLWSVASSIATTDQSHAILDLIEAKWGDLVANMPFKIWYHALDGRGTAIMQVPS